MELVNTPENLVGAFTSQSISDVVYPNCSDILAKYIQVAPLLNEDGTGNAVKLSYEWEIGGYIPANSPHPEEAFALMDLMLSEEAALIATFGEEGVDWKYSDKGDISTYGVSARITTLNYLEDSVQNKNFAGAGPCVLKPEYANGVTWNGNNSLMEYIDARAVKSYEPYYKDVAAPQSEDNIIVAADEMKELKAYTDEMIWLFLTRQLPVEEDEAWNIFCSEYMELAKRAVKIQ